MSLEFITGLLALGALLFAVAVFGSRWSQMQRLPFATDRSTPKDSPTRGLLYAFTLGMMPWAKESTRLHTVAYLRGIAFHVGIFAGLAALLASPWFGALPALLLGPVAVITGFGAVMGIAGGIMRIVEPPLKAISTPDDHASVWLVTVYLAATTVALVSPAFLPGMYVTAAVMLVYAPLGKIKHCIYFFFGRFFYGLHIGRRGIVRGLEASHGR